MSFFFFTYFTDKTADRVIICFFIHIRATSKYKTMDQLRFASSSSHSLSFPLRDVSLLLLVRLFMSIERALRSDEYVLADLCLFLCGGRAGFNYALPAPGLM